MEQFGGKVPHPAMFRILRELRAEICHALVHRARIMLRTDQFQTGADEMRILVLGQIGDDPAAYRRHQGDDLRELRHGRPVRPGPVEHLMDDHAAQLQRFDEGFHAHRLFAARHDPAQRFGQHRTAQFQARPGIEWGCMCCLRHQPIPPPSGPRLREACRARTSPPTGPARSSRRSFPGRWPRRQRTRPAGRLRPSRHRSSRA